MTCPRRVVGLMALGLVLSGCPLQWQRITINETIEPEDVTFIRAGETTLSEVVAKLGAPDEISDTRDGAVARYRFRDARYFRVNFGYAVKFFTPPGTPDDMVLAGGGTGTHEFHVVFDAKWVVQYHAFARHLSASQYRFWPFDTWPFSTSPLPGEEG
ncbi:MAG: hypothetical protein ACREIO_03555 [Nitrospiraceae bacterium]